MSLAYGPNSVGGSAHAGSILVDFPVQVTDSEADEPECAHVVQERVPVSLVLVLMKLTICGSMAVLFEHTCTIILHLRGSA